MIHYLIFQAHRALLPDQEPPEGTEALLSAVVGEALRLKRDARETRPLEELVRAHDLIGGVILNPKVSDALLPTDQRATLMANEDVLCWMLRHEHNGTFAANLRLLEDGMRALGLELKKHDFLPTLPD